LLSVVAPLLPKEPDALPFRSTLGEFSPNSLMTGNWEEASAIRLAQQKQNEWRPFTLSKIEDESNDIRSFYLKPSDTGALLPFKAGQYLTLKVSPANTEKPLIRTYTISSAPNEAYYRISVKKEDEGAVSKYLHNHLQYGDVIEIKAPKGNFYINPLEKRPAVLIAGGVGITPMISMALHVYNEGLRMRQIRSLTIIQASKTSDSRAFSDEFATLEKISNGQIRYISFLSKPSSNDKAGINFNGSGRIDAQTYKEILSLDDYDFFLCGSADFMQSQYNALIELSVSDNRIFAEAFGPASLQRQHVIQPTKPQHDLEASQSIIKFTKSKFEQPWSQGEKTLLETAEDHGLSPEFSCRNGNCGACVTKISAGKVTYRTKPTTNIKENEVLICCAVPAKGSNTIELDL
jgi:ferredoxin-NADP reductase